ncbi:MAG: RNA polymerase sigma factor RpoD/SigA [Opitutia bacterium]
MIQTQLLQDLRLPSGARPAPTPDRLSPGETTPDPSILSELAALADEAFAKEPAEFDGLGDYLRRACHREKLEPAEETMLGRALRAGRRADGSFTPAGRLAFDEFVERNLRLVVYFAKRFARNRDDLLDLISAGNLGLMTATCKFDPERGIRFSTFAAWDIHSQIVAEVRQRHRPVHLPRNIHEQLTAARRAEAELTQKLGREPTEAEVSLELGWAADHLTGLRRLTQAGVSLDAPPDNEGGLTLADRLKDEEAIDPAHAAERGDRAAFVRALLERLDGRERRILCLRHGVGTDHEWTLEEIGATLGVTRERVRQLEGIALQKLRTEAAARPAA